MASILDTLSARPRLTGRIPRAWSARLGRPAGRVRHLASRIGVRLAFVQALVLVSALGLAGYMSHVSDELIARRSIERQIVGETNSIHEEFAQKGAGRIPHTIEKRSRIWRGFEYRLVGPDGVWRAGSLPDPGPDLGWSTLAPRRPGAAVRRYRAYSTRLDDGSVLTVAQDLASEAKRSAAMAKTLVWCGGAGVAAGFAVSYLFMGGAWRRVAALSRAAHEVSTGRLDVRVATRATGTRDDIDELGLAFNAMLAEIDNLMGQVRQVSTSIAHDLRTPLTRVRQRLERLKSVAQGSAEMTEGVDRIDADLEELLRSFDAMLRLAEIENAAGGASAAPIDLGEVALRVTEAYRPDMEDDGRTLSADVEPAVIRGDGQLIAHALANLFDNALRHTPAGTPIALQVRRLPEGGAFLLVSDRGPGVAASDRDAVLQRFHRLDPSRAGSGSGLGLAIVAAIAKRHRAKLSLGDAGPGLRVALRFPAP